VGSFLPRRRFPAPGLAQGTSQAARGGAARALLATLLGSSASCALIVGDPHGELAAPADAASESAIHAEGGAHPEAGSNPETGANPEAGTAEAGANPESGSYACANGGCNAAMGACSGPGACHCTDDSQCLSAKCVKTRGQNDLSCQACTGSGPADGFGCLLAANGIPAACTLGVFGYAPANFDPTLYTPPLNATTDCTATYSSTTHMFTSGSCAGQAPTIKSAVAQTDGGHVVDILVFKSLTLSSNLTLTGANPVILAVYGDATITGTINASALGATPGPGGNACATLSNGAATTTGSWEPGAGGGGQSAAGGAGGGSRTAAAGAGGIAQSSGTAPLAGGCAGAVPAVGSLGFSPVAGAGGGGVQISAAGVLNVTGGTITANGSNGTGGEGGNCSSLAQNGTGGAGGGSGGTILLEGINIRAGTYRATGGTGGAGGAAPSPNSQAGGAGGAGGTAGAVGGTGGAGIQNGTTPAVCSWGGIWSGGGGGGGAGGFVTTHGGSTAGVCATSLVPRPVCVGGQTCLCVADSDCSSGLCSSASSQCTGTCSGTTAAGTYDAVDCQILTATGP
jgi:hypothetical protein